tara:strand:+ start:2880 stop:3440 length:561 start_codon:yes stop_codon:yes gene_type:complete
MSKFFRELNEIDVSEHTEKKGNFTYLSWAWAVRELLKVDPEATWEIHEWGLEGNRQPYMQTEAGCFVQVTVWVGGIARTQVHPVLDNRNQTIKEPNAFQVNTSIQRCLAKAIALHGLGLYIFAGEDVPQVKRLSDEQCKELDLHLAELKDIKTKNDILKKVEQNVINDTNFKGAIAKIKRLVSEQS